MSFHYFSEFPGEEAAKSAMAAAAARMAQADFSMVNLENIFGEPDEGEPIVKSGPNLISSPDFMAYVRALSPAVVGLANNHTRDFGDIPMLHTMQMLRDDGRICIGAGRNLDEAYKSVILEKDGVRAAVFAVCENEFGTASENTGGTAGYSLTRVSHAIRDARQNGCKPIVYFHGGTEYSPFPSPNKVELYRHFIELGAEAVIAMHTHCPQGYEIYEGKPIVYSMGNFFFPLKNPSKRLSWQYGYMTELTLSEDGVSMELCPYRFTMDGITLLDGEEKASFEAYLACLNAPIDDPAALRAYFDGWCLSSAYTQYLSGYKKEMFADGNTEKIKTLRNLLTCEAHNELLCNTMCMIYEGRVTAAEPYWEKIQKLQNLQTD